MNLPAHRFEGRKGGKQTKGQRTWVFDYDGTITGAPDQIVRIATGLRALGDYLIILTGSTLPRADLVKQLADFGMPYDDLVQYTDDGTDGQARVHYLKQFGAWGGFDNRVDRAPILVEVCPHLFVIAQPVLPDDKAAKKDAKQTAKKLGLRSESRGAPRVPPHYRPMDTMVPGARPLPEGSSCGGCDMNNSGLCWGYGNVRIEADHVCDSFDPEQDQAAESAANQ